MTSATNAQPEGAGDTETTRVYTRTTSYTVTCFAAAAHPFAYVFDVKVDETAPGRWAIRRGPACLSAMGTWEYEPIPSERDEDFLAAFRFDLRTALELAERVAPDVVINGRRAGDVARESADDIEDGGE